MILVSSNKAALQIATPPSPQLAQGQSQQTVRLVEAAFLGGIPQGSPQGGWAGKTLWAAGLGTLSARLT